MRKAEAYLNVRRLYRKTQRYAKDDPEVALILARKTAEAVCKFLYSTRISPDPNSLMLEALLTTLQKERAIPRKILTPLHAIQTYGNFSGHDQEDEYGDIDSDYARPCVHALNSVIEWFETEHTILDWAFTASVHHVGFSKKTVDVLNMACRTSLSDVAVCTEADLLKYRGLGKKMLNEIKAVLAEHGLSLGMKIDPKLIERVSNKRIRQPYRSRDPSS